MLSYGCARLEIGVQSTYEDVARDNNRGHTIAAVADCFCVAKDAIYKVVACMMPDLPNVGVERDMESFREFFEIPLFRADGLKIYPTLVIRGTGLYELWKTGRYRNYPPEQLVDIVARILAMVPPWTRVYRVQQDIPMPLVTSGVEKGNLRGLAFAWMEDLGLKCRERLEFRTYITKLGQTKWSLFVVIIWQMKDGKHFFHMKILARYTPGEFPLPSETRSAEFYKMASRTLSDITANTI
ncbi:hypothetical protein ACFX1R_040641 [Malus domestica]